jgi:hypothetical protein
MNPLKSIIYFNSGAIGEFLMTLYFADAVRRAAENQHVPIPQIIVPVRRNAPFLRELGKEYSHLKVVSIEPGSVYSAFRYLLHVPQPTIVLTQQTFSSLPLRLKLFAWIVAKARRARFAGFTDSSPVNPFLYNQTWEFNIRSSFPKEMLRLAGNLGYEAAYETPRLRYSSGRPPYTQPYFVFHLRSFTPARTWPEYKWRHVLQTVRKKYPEFLFVFSGSAEDAAMIERVTKQIPQCISLAGKSPAELVGTIDHAQLFIGVDTGITHLAAFRGVPMVVLGTNSTPSWWATYNPQTRWLTENARCSCSGDKKGACTEEAEGAPRFRCLLDISEQAVLEAIETTRIDASSSERYYTN